MTMPKQETAATDSNEPKENTDKFNFGFIHEPTAAHQLNMGYGSTSPLLRGPLLATTILPDDPRWVAFEEDAATVAHDERMQREAKELAAALDAGAELRQRVHLARTILADDPRWGTWTLEEDQAIKNMIAEGKQRAIDADKADRAAKTEWLNAKVREATSLDQPIMLPINIRVAEAGVWVELEVPAPLLEDRDFSVSMAADGKIELNFFLHMPPNPFPALIAMAKEHKFGNPVGPTKATTPFDE